MVGLSCAMAPVDSATVAATMATAETAYFMFILPCAPRLRGAARWCVHLRRLGCLMRPRCRSAVHTQLSKIILLARAKELLRHVPQARDPAHFVTQPHPKLIHISNTGSSKP